MKKENGFTLIELLAVIIILGVLMIIAIPSVTKYIDDSRKNGYVSTAKSIIGGARNLIHSGELDLNDHSATYYIPSSCIKTEKGDNSISPFGEFDLAYVIITYDRINEKYNYYWMSVDENGVGVKSPIEINSLDTSVIESGITKTEFEKEIKTLDNHSKFILYNDDCTNKTEKKTTGAGTILPVNECTFNGTLTSGVEYVNGQYTYTYMQNENVGESFYSIIDDGWRVVLTDKDSTDPITTKICTSINGKPIVSMKNMFKNSKTTSIDVSSFDTSHVKNMWGMFSNATNIRELDLSTFNTSKVVFHSEIFSGDSNLETLILDNWDLRNNTSTGGHFVGCTKLKTLSLRNWKLPHEPYVSIAWRWNGAGSPIETIDVTGWDLSATNDINSLFGGCARLKNIIGINTWDTSTITNMNALFLGCSSLTNLDLSNWNTKNVTNMGAMFSQVGSNATSFNLNVSNFNTSKVSNIENIFDGVATSATDYNILIPRTNGNGINNTTSTIYGSNISNSFTLPDDKQFTFAN